MFAHSPSSDRRGRGGVRRPAAGRYGPSSRRTPPISSLSPRPRSRRVPRRSRSPTPFSGSPSTPNGGHPCSATAGGGLSGDALHSVALRAVYDCRAAFPGAAIVGVGGVSDGLGAVRMLLAGADAVQVGTATLGRSPRPSLRVQAELAVVVRPTPGERSSRARRGCERQTETRRAVMVPDEVPPTVRDRLVLALDVASLDEAVELADATAAVVLGRQGRLGALLRRGAARGRRAVGRGLPGVRGPEAARHPDDGRPRRPEDRVSRGVLRDGARGRWRRDVEGGGGGVRGGMGRRSGDGHPEPAGGSVGVLAVTVLTSEPDAGAELVGTRASLAARTGCLGVVCAAADLPVVRSRAPGPFDGGPRDPSRRSSAGRPVSGRGAVGRRQRRGRPARHRQDRDRLQSPGTGGRAALERGPGRARSQSGLPRGRPARLSR